MYKAGEAKRMILVLVFFIFSEGLAELAALLTEFLL